MENKIFGVGTDIENIERFRDLDRTMDKLFLDKIFTKNELGYCFSKENAAPHLAARFAGKEAVIKALSSVKMHLNYKDVEILSDEGIPKVKITSFKNLMVSISLSHCEDKAIAFVITMGVKNGKY